MGNDRIIEVEMFLNKKYVSHMYLGRYLVERISHKKGTYILKFYFITMLIFARYLK